MNWAFGLLISALIAATTIQGPVLAKVERVYDGDTFTVEAYPWPGVETRASVRVNGVDTPELRGKCPEEKALAVKARDFVKDRVLGGDVFLSGVKYGKYAGRVVADVTLMSGENLAQLLINEGLGVPYDGGKRKSWCGP